MRAMRINSAGSSPILVAADIPQPQPGVGEVLIQVRAAGVIAAELGWYPTLHTRTGEPRLDAVPSHEFSGVVAALGKGAAGFEVGRQVYGMNDWFADGALAEFCITRPENIAAKPVTLAAESAGSVPISALTAWQGLLDRAKIQRGERVLIQGGAGAVGIFAVQLAHLHSTHVIATASVQDTEFVKQLGADEVIDYRSSRFEDKAGKVDVVFDTVGGETLERSWNVLKPGGRMVTIASGAAESTELRVKDAFFIVEPSQSQLIEVAKLLDAGTLNTFVKAVVPLDRAAEAYDGSLLREHRKRGKIVVSVSS